MIESPGWILHQRQSDKDDHEAGTPEDEERSPHWDVLLSLEK
jgi:hypothetical protein